MMTLAVPSLVMMCAGDISLFQSTKPGADVTAKLNFSTQLLPSNEVEETKLMLP